MRASSLHTDQDVAPHISTISAQAMQVSSAGPLPESSTMGTRYAPTSRGFKYQLDKTEII